MIYSAIDTKIRFFQVGFAADLYVSNLPLLIEMYGKSSLLDLGQSLHALCVNTSHDSSRFIETNEVFTDVKHAIEECEWNGLFEIKYEGSSSVWLEDCDWNHTASIESAICKQGCIKMLRGPSS